MSKNMEIYERVRAVPKEAQKTIGGGRLKGMTDINPMWRIKTLTENFGPCGVGWYYEITDRWLETSMASDEITANVKINMYVRIGEEWSKPIQGVGGSMFISREKGGIYTDDECYKKALTDAISVSCKALGFGADIYWSKDTTKYTDPKKENPENIVESIKERETWRGKVLELAHEKGIDPKELSKDYGLKRDTSVERFKEVYEDLKGEGDEAAK